MPKREHDLSEDCWCRPIIIEDLALHNTECCPCGEHEVCGCVCHDGDPWRRAEAAGG